MALVALAACGSKRDEAVREVVTAVVGSGKLADQLVGKPPPTPAQRAAYKQHWKAALALEKDKKWAEAVAELEVALAVIDGDQRALAELGFAAMNAGDYVKARKADEEAVRVAVDKKIKAAGLYNLGMVQKKSGDLEGARASFTASLALRPSRTVSDELSGLGAPSGPAVPFCAAGAKPCDCIAKAAFGAIDKEDPPACTAATEPKLPALPGFHLYRIEWNRWTWRYLLDENDQLVAVIDGGFERMRASETLQLDKAELRTIGGHQVLWIQTTDEASETSDSSDDAMAIDSARTTAVTVCVIGDGKTRCPLVGVPITQSTEVTRTAIDDNGTPGATTGTSVETAVDLAIADDGTATVKLVKGPSDAQLDKLIGPHRLW